MKYLIQKECYYGEPGQRPRHYKAGTAYESATLLPEKAPPYFKLLDAPKAAAKTAEPSAPANEPAGLGMSYNEMKKFVKDNDIEVSGSTKKELEEGIIAFNEAVALKKKLEVEGTTAAQKVASDLKAGELNEANDPEEPMTQGGE